MKRNSMKMQRKPKKKAYWLILVDASMPAGKTSRGELPGVNALGANNRGLPNYDYLGRAQSLMVTKTRK